MSENVCKANIWLLNNIVVTKWQSFLVFSSSLQTFMEMIHVGFQNHGNLYNPLRYYPRTICEYGNTCWILNKWGSGQPILLVQGHIGMRKSWVLLKLITHGITLLKVGKEKLKTMKGTHPSAS